MGTPLTDSEVISALQKLPGWKRTGVPLERVYEFPDFREAMLFVNRVADAAEQANHHPDISISYNKVALRLVSHDSGGVTQKDIRMAQDINEISGEGGE